MGATMRRPPRWVPLLLGASLLAGCSSGIAATSPEGGASTGQPTLPADTTPAGGSAAPGTAAVEVVAVTGMPRDLSPGVHDVRVEVDASAGPRVRRVRLVVPLGEGPFPVVVALHGLTGNGRDFDEQTGVGAAGAGRGAVVVLPDGADGAWNASTTCCEPALSGKHPDAGFVLGLLDEVARALPIVDGRAGVTGFSNGAFLAYRLACRAADRIGAVAVVAGTMEEACLPSRPVSVLHLHGEDDRVVPFVDDRAPYSPQAASRGAADVAAAWARLDDCAAAPRSDGDGLAWTGCADGTAVSFLPVADLAHAWPVDAPSATTTVLDFLLSEAG